MNEMYSAAFVSHKVIEASPNALEIAQKAVIHALKYDNCTDISVTTTEGEMQNPETLEVEQGFNIVALGKRPRDATEVR